MFLLDMTSEQENTPDSYLRLTRQPRQQRLSDVIAALTETKNEADIDLRMGLRGSKGRLPRQEDFYGLLRQNGNWDYPK